VVYALGDTLYNTAGRANTTFAHNRGKDSWENRNAAAVKEDKENRNKT
jgi:hypothetical protein